MEKNFLKAIKTETKYMVSREDFDKQLGLEKDSTAVDISIEAESVYLTVQTKQIAQESEETKEQEEGNENVK